MTFLSALILGLIASAHCAGMCGGVQFALSGPRAEQPLIRADALQRRLLLLNTGRIITYVLAGALLGTLGLGVTMSLPIAQTAEFLRLLSGALILLIGVQLLIRTQRPLAVLESIGWSLWERSERLIQTNPALRAPHAGQNGRVVLLGMLWGLLPCGLVYGVLLAAIFAATPIESASIMLGFGLATLPALLLTGHAFHQLKQWLNASSVQFAGGVFFTLGGVMMLTAPYWVDQSFLRHYPEVANAVFCLTP